MNTSRAGSNVPCFRETCTNTAMVRLRGRAPRGERLVDYAPHGAWSTVTFVGALRQCGMTAPFVSRARLVPGDREIANLVETIRRETEKKNVE